MLVSTLIAICAAHALQPPVGWTALGSDRAVMVAQDPGRGEVRELRVDGASIDAQALVTALNQAGEQATLTGQAADGTVTLRLGREVIARARAHPGSASVTWYLVVAHSRHAENLDADALLTAMVPRTLPTHLQGQVEVLPAGRDGSLWDTTPAAEPTAAPATDLWGAPVQAAPSAWGQRASLVGIWGGTVGGPWGGGTEYVFTFDATGRLRIEERTADGSQVTEGTWEASGDQLRLSSYTAEPLVLAYSSDGKSLGITWQGQPLTLFPRR